MDKKKKSGELKTTSAPRRAKSNQALPPLPNPRAMERIMRELVADLGEMATPATPLDRAQDVMYRAFEASGSQQVRLAREALEICPDCADAFVLLAEHAQTPEEAMRLYEQGVAAGRRAVGERPFEESVGHFWGLLETRPYMRARAGLAMALWQAGRREDAAEHYRDMLRLNPNDNQGNRDSLAGLLLELERDAELRQLLTKYENDPSAQWVYMKVLAAFREEGDTPRARELLAQATKANEHVPAFLLGHHPLPKDFPPYITLGGEDEAASYARDHRRGWLNTSGAISWLRKTLNVPLPEAGRPRQAHWPRLRAALSRLPQEPGEVWQVDAVQAPTSTGSHWVILIVGRSEAELLDLDVLESQPMAADVWERLTDAMWKPQDGEPRRPATIEVRQPAFRRAWQAKLKQLGIQCLLLETLDAIDAARDDLPSISLDPTEDQIATASVSPEEVLELPQEAGEVWQAGVQPMPAWITGEGQPYRPWMAIVANRTDELVLAHALSPEPPSAGWLWGAILQAMRRPAVGSPHRPGVVEVASGEHADALRRHLDQFHVECVELPRLDFLETMVDDMAQHFGGPTNSPSLLDVPGMEPARVGSFYAAAADFYRHKPWLQAPSDAAIRIECDKFQSGPWYAVVMGQSGIEQGLAMYEDLNALRKMTDGNGSEEENARGMSALSLMFGEAFEISVRDLDAIEKHGWPVAGPEAFPLVIRINPGLATRPPLAWELELLDGCLQAIPAFLANESAAASQIVRTATGELNMRLAWLDGTGGD